MLWGYIGRKLYGFWAIYRRRRRGFAGLMSDYKMKPLNPEPQTLTSSPELFSSSQVSCVRRRGVISWGYIRCMVYRGSGLEVRVLGWC